VVMAGGRNDAAIADALKALAGVTAANNSKQNDLFESSIPTSNDEDDE
ncbi:hypothetical protein A2U01_0015725, partial [Trifolium medium]|nr:hypothetical protein [Trifolium medium]